MEINKFKVRPRRLKSSILRANFGAWVGHDDDEELEASYLWRQEIGLAAADRQEWSKHAADIEALQAMAGIGAPLDSVLAWAKQELQAATGRFEGLFEAEKALAHSAWKTHDKTIDKLVLESSCNLVEIIKNEQSPLDRLDGLQRKYAKSVKRINDIRDEYTGLIDDFRQLGRRRAEFWQSDESVKLDQIDAMHPTAFEQHVAAMLEREQMLILQRNGGTGDRGVDVIAMTTDKEQVAVQVKQRSDSAAVVPTEVHAFNGTARPEHKAKIALFVTNQRFTEEAAAFARRHKIDLIDRPLLHRWSALGDPLGALTPLHSA